MGRPRSNTPVPLRACEPVPPMLMCARGGFILVIVLAVAAQVCVHSAQRIPVGALVVEQTGTEGRKGRAAAPTPRGSNASVPHEPTTYTYVQQQSIPVQSPSSSLFATLENWSAVLAAVIGVAGYIGDHITARKAEARQAKLERVVAQAHEFLTPMITQGHGGISSLQAFLTEMEREFGDIWPAGMLDKVPKGRWRLVCGDGVTSKEAALQYGKSLPTSIVAHVWTWNVWAGRYVTVDGELGRRSNYTVSFEMPEGLVTLLEAELAAARGGRPRSRLWTRYERYIRREWLPAVEEMERLVTDHGDLMEPIDAATLEKTFGHDVIPAGRFAVMPRMALYSSLLAYARGWRSHLEGWDAGEYDAIRPTVPFPVGFLAFTIEGATRVAAHEKILVGSSQQHGVGPLQAVNKA